MEILSISTQDLRKNLRVALRQVRGNTVMVITIRGKSSGKLLVDKHYFEGLLNKLKSSLESIEIVKDRDFMNRLRIEDADLNNNGLSSLKSLSEVFQV